MKKNFLLLQNAPHLPIDGKLKDILKATPGACLTYAVIEGNQAFTSKHKYISHKCLCAIGLTVFNCRHSATSGGASDESLPKRNYGSVAEIHIEWAQAGVEQHYTHLVRFELCRIMSHIYIFWKNGSKNNIYNNISGITCEDFFFFSFTPLGWTTYESYTKERMRCHLSWWDQMRPRSESCPLCRPLGHTWR